MRAAHGAKGPNRTTIPAAIVAAWWRGWASGPCKNAAVHGVALAAFSQLGELIKLRTPAFAVVIDSAIGVVAEIDISDKISPQLLGRQGPPPAANSAKAVWRGK